MHTATPRPSGVHRLVRISPLIPTKEDILLLLDHVIAEMEDDGVDIDIPDDDLRIDTYRSSGKGGQHVNKTDSAVRLTHLPPISSCSAKTSVPNSRTSRPQCVCSSRVFMKSSRTRKEPRWKSSMAKKGEMGGGTKSQLCFSALPNGQRFATGVETSAVQSVMDGELDSFVNGWLRAGCPRQRNKDIQVDD